MLTPNDKRRIYSAITAAFPTEEEYSFEKIDALLNKNGFRSADFGYAKRRNMLEDLPEFLTLKETVIGQNRHLLVTVHVWPEGEAARSGAEGAGEGAGESPAAGQGPGGSGAERAVQASSGEEGVLTEKDRREIYEILSAAFPFEEQRHMAAPNA